MASTIDGHAGALDERLSWEQFLQLPDLSDGRRAVALLDGVPVYMAPPRGRHESIVRNVVVALHQWTAGGLDNGLAVPSPLVHVAGRPLGYVGDAGWFRPGTVQLDADGEFAYTAAPALVVEVWSPSNWAGEIHRKARDYARADVTELWGLHQSERVLTRYAEPIDGDYTTIVDFGPETILTTPLLNGFKLPIADAFAV